MQQNDVQPACTWWAEVTQVTVNLSPSTSLQPLNTNTDTLSVLKTTSMNTVGHKKHCVAARKCLITTSDHNGLNGRISRARSDEIPSGLGSWLSLMWLDVVRPMNTFIHQSSSSRMRVVNHNWSATKQRPHPQSVAEISRHSVSSGDRIWQCETSSGSRHKETDQCL